MKDATCVSVDMFVRALEAQTTLLQDVHAYCTQHSGGMAVQGVCFGSSRCA